MAKFGRSIAGPVKKYTRKTTAINTYMASWGTPSSQSTKECVSLKLAKHPLLAWAYNIKEIASRVGFTADERRAAMDLVEAIDNLGDFDGGERSFEIALPTLNMKFSAKLLRIAQ